MEQRYFTLLNFPIFFFAALTHLPKILVQEALIDDENDEPGDILEVLQRDAEKTIKMTNIISRIDIPMYEVMKARIELTERRIEELMKVKDELTQKIAALS